MTIFEAATKFSGLACPQCRHLVVIPFNYENLFTRFTEFDVQSRVHDDCCVKFLGKLNQYTQLHSAGKISKIQLAEKLGKYKLTL